MAESLVPAGIGQRVNGAGAHARVRLGETTRFVVGDQKGYVTTGRDTDGELAEVVIRMAKQGSTLAGMMDALGVAISLGLRAGAPLETYLAKFTNMRFTPAGRTDDPELPMATSIMDYVARRLAVDYLPAQRRAALGVLTTDERRAEAVSDDAWADLPGLAMSAPM
jgi:ribonucleoside-diphosphate reductase alpha chain